MYETWGAEGSCVVAAAVIEFAVEDGNLELMWAFAPKTAAATNNADKHKNTRAAPAPIVAVFLIDPQKRHEIQLKLRNNFTSLRFKIPRKCSAGRTTQQRDAISS
ncbi:hypothetical protein NL676_012399 [Syzygium grande]|nr:hypothetical protein NL676_012399 [Syzygium grande]